MAEEEENPASFLPLPRKLVLFPRLNQGTFSGPRRRTGYETTQILLVVHLLGMDHTIPETALMYPYYRPGLVTPHEVDGHPPHR